IVSRPSHTQDSQPDKGQEQHSSDLKTIIAGYPWFADWGRDSMISLPGLRLSTGRYNEARGLLKAFASYTHGGLIPNRFPDSGEAPEYNTIDATLWMFHALDRYLKATEDWSLLNELFLTLSSIIDWHVEGTIYGIGVDPADGLLHGGTTGVQLTWMDAKIGDWVVTPRHGKPVEINALWYNNLRIMALLATHAHDSVRAAAFTHLAEQVARVFETTYFNLLTKCLNEVVADDGTPDPSIRPNQLIAVSLPFSPLSTEAQIGVVAAGQKLLLTPMGMRTLAPGSPGYHGRCTGDQRARDMAYHQGT